MGHGRDRPWLLLPLWFLTPPAHFCPPPFFSPHRFRSGYSIRRRSETVVGFHRGALSPLRRATCAPLSSSFSHFRSSANVRVFFLSGFLFPPGSARLTLSPLPALLTRQWPIENSFSCSTLFQRPGPGAHPGRFSRVRVLEAGLPRSRLDLCSPYGPPGPLGAVPPPPPPPPPGARVRRRPFFFFAVSSAQRQNHFSASCGVLFFLCIPALIF